MFILEKMNKERMKYVQELSDFIISDLDGENDYSVVVMALLDVAVRVIKTVTGCDNVSAVNTLISILTDIRKAEEQYDREETN